MSPDGQDGEDVRLEEAKGDLLNLSPLCMTMRFKHCFVASEVWKLSFAK